jgi:spermidine/putrescine-binding protein
MSDANRWRYVRTRRQLLRDAAIAGAGLAAAACAPAGTAIASASAGAGGSAKLSGELRFATYGGAAFEKIVNEIIKPWGTKNGVTVTYTTLDTEDGMLARLRASPDDYDMIFDMGEIFTARAIKEKLLAPWNYDLIPNLTKNMQPDVLALGKKAGLEPYGVIYGRDGYTLTYNKNKLTPAPTSLRAFYDPQFKGRVSTRDYSVIRVGWAALTLGYDPNNFNADQENKVFQLLADGEKVVKNHWTSFAQNETLLRNEEIWLADQWGIERVGLPGETLQGFYPKDGAIVWVDVACLSKGAKNIPAAHALINYLLEPDPYMSRTAIMGLPPTLKAGVADVNKYFVANPPAKALLDWHNQGPTYIQDPNFFLPKVADWDRRWAEIKLNR